MNLGDWLIVIFVFNDDMVVVVVVVVNCLGFDVLGELFIVGFDDM